MGRVVVAIFGARGMLGSDVAAACMRSGYDVHAHDLPEFDITNSAQMHEAAGAADALINCAAYTNVDGAETQRELAYRVNAEAAGQLGRLAADRGKWVLHFSTDFVFDGTLDRPYVETDITGPVNEYGRSKLAGERLLGESGCSYCIVRLQWTYGLGGTNFVTKVIERARAGGSLRVVEDQVGSPTATTDAAEAACQLLDERVDGLFHFAAAGYVSRFGVAKFVLERLGLETELLPCRSGDYPSPAQRPLDSRFDCGKIASRLGTPIRPWQESMERFVRQL